jgi:hypothetical protein
MNDNELADKIQKIIGAVATYNHTADFGSFIINELLKTDPDSLEVFLELYDRKINGKPEPQKVTKVEMMPWLQDRAG